MRDYTAQVNTAVQLRATGCLSGTQPFLPIPEFKSIGVSHVATSL